MFQYNLFYEELKSKKCNFEMLKVIVGIEERKTPLSINFHSTYIV